MNYVYVIEVNDRPHHYSNEFRNTVEDAKKFARKVLSKSITGEVKIGRGEKSKKPLFLHNFMLCRYIVHPRTGRKKVIFQRWKSGMWGFGSRREK